jgi:hypothetical protein
MDISSNTILKYGYRVLKKLLPFYISPFICAYHHGGKPYRVLKVFDFY